MDRAGASAPALSPATNEIVDSILVAPVPRDAETAFDCARPVAIRTRR